MGKARGAKLRRREQRRAAGEKADQNDIHLLAARKVRRVLGRPGMGFHQEAGNAKLGAVAVRKVRVGVGAIGERLHMVSLRAQKAHRLLLHQQLRRAKRGEGGAAHFQAVSVVFVAAVPIVRIHHEVGAQHSEQMGQGARFRLRKASPIAVQIGRSAVEARARLRAVGVCHRHHIQRHAAQALLQGRVLPRGYLVNHMKQGFGGSRLIAMLTADDKEAGRGWRGSSTWVMQAHQPQRAPLHRLPGGGKAHPRGAGGIGAQPRGHLRIGRDRGRGGGEHGSVRQT